LGLVLRLADELPHLPGTFTEFFLSRARPNTDNIQVNPRTLDWPRLKREDERHERDRARA
jgi:hypothetical protein